MPRQHSYRQTDHMAAAAAPAADLGALQVRILLGPCIASMYTGGSRRGSLSTEGLYTTGVLESGILMQHRRRG